MGKCKLGKQMKKKYISQITAGHKSLKNNENILQTLNVNTVEIIPPKLTTKFTQGLDNKNSSKPSTIQIVLLNSIAHV